MNTLLGGLFSSGGQPQSDNVSTGLREAAIATFRNTKKKGSTLLGGLLF